MQDLINKLEHKCRDLGVNFHLNSQISIQDLKGSAIVIATSANAAHILTKDYAPTISHLLSQIKMSSLMSVTVFFEKFQTKFKGFGCLIPREMNIQTLGILMNSYIFKDRDKTYNETWIMGGYHNEQLLEKTDSQIIELIQKERQQVLQDSSKILSYRINRWSKALPYYDVDLEIILEKLSKENLPEGLYLHGNYLSGIGLSKILEKSDLIAAQIEKDYEKK
jgi:oxygen-dependent protoporphyrinogen oxidase